MFMGAVVSLLYLTNTVEPVTITPVPLSKPTPVEIFMKEVAKIESDGNHRVVNEFGMMGKYQFSPSTVRVLGFRMSKQQFLNNPQIQDTVMLAYMRANYRDLKHYIEKYNGKVFKGIKITRAGVLAGAHFAGSGNVKKYFSSSDIEGLSDARGTTLRYYMKQFSNFHLPELL